MEHDANARQRRKAECAGEAEGVEEGKNAQDAVAVAQVEDLFELLHVGTKIEMGEHHALRFAGGAAGEDDRRGVVQ